MKFKVLVFCFLSSSFTLLSALISHFFLVVWNFNILINIKFFNVSGYVWDCMIEYFLLVDHFSYYFQGLFRLIFKIFFSYIEFVIRFDEQIHNFQAVNCISLNFWLNKFKFAMIKLPESQFWNLAVSIFCRLNLPLLKYTNIAIIIFSFEPL